MCCRRLAPMRLVPFSYFWICWNVMPRCSPSFSWLMPSIMRRRRTRLPTWMSIGFGCFLLAISASCFLVARQRTASSASPGRVSDAHSRHDSQSRQHVFNADRRCQRLGDRIMSDPK